MDRKLLLLVDDDADDVLFFEEALRAVAPGIRFRSLENGEAAQAYLLEGSERPDWIFLDLNMPKMNGMQLLRALKERAIDLAPVIVYTTSHLDKDRELSLELGASAFITKPSRLPDLEAAIREVLEGR